jgi:hypothetical protein
MREPAGATAGCDRLSALSLLLAFLVRAVRPASAQGIGDVLNSDVLGVSPQEVAVFRDVRRFKNVLVTNLSKNKQSRIRSTQRWQQIGSYVHWRDDFGISRFWTQSELARLFLMKIVYAGWFRDGTIFRSKSAYNGCIYRAGTSGIFDDWRNNPTVQSAVVGSNWLNENLVGDDVCALTNAGSLIRFVQYPSGDNADYNQASGKQTNFASPSRHHSFVDLVWRLLFLWHFGLVTIH